MLILRKKQKNQWSKKSREDKNSTDYYYPNWFDKKTFKNMLAIVSNEFNYKTKIGEFKYLGIKDLVKYLLKKV